MRRILPALLALAPLALAATSADAAPARNRNKGTPINITVNNDRFIPDRINMRAGQSYILRITNRSDRRHSFSATKFFGYARVAPQDAGWITDNKVDLKPGQSARLRIVAPTTHNAVYDYRSTNLLDAAENLKGTIYVR